MIDVIRCNGQYHKKSLKKTLPVHSNLTAAAAQRRCQISKFQTDDESSTTRCRKFCRAGNTAHPKRILPSRSLLKCMSKPKVLYTI